MRIRDREKNKLAKRQIYCFNAYDAVYENCKWTKTILSKVKAIFYGGYQLRNETY